MKDIKQRTKEFSLRIIRLFSSLPESTTAHVTGKQLLRSGTSVGAQQELEETASWLELFTEAGIVAQAKFSDLQN